MSRQGSVHRRGAPLPVLLVGIAALVVVLAALRSASPGTRGPVASTAATTAATAAPGAAGAPPSGPVGSLVTRLLPQGLDDRGWIAEVGVQRWVAGTLSGHVLVLPSDEVGLAATASSVVSVRYANGGATSTVRVRDFAGNRLRVSVDRPGTVSSAVTVGGTLYVSGDDGSGATDSGVQAISMANGSVTDVIAAGAAPGGFAGPVTRGQLRLSPSGRTLAAPLCAGDECAIDVIDIETGRRTTTKRTAAGLLLAVSDFSVFLTDELSASMRAVDVAAGATRWSVSGAQVGGVLPSADGSHVVVGMVLRRAQDTKNTFVLAAIDTTTGTRTELLRRAADTDAVSFFPGLSDDRFAVIGNGTLPERLGGGGRRIALTLVDARSGATLADAVTLTAP